MLASACTPYPGEVLLPAVSAVLRPTLSCYQPVTAAADILHVFAACKLTIVCGILLSQLMKKGHKF